MPSSSDLIDTLARALFQAATDAMSRIVD